MQTLLVDLILAAAVGAVFLIALRGRKIGWGKGFPGSSLANFFNLFWGWADYTRRIGRTPRISENIPRGVQARFRTAGFIREVC
jgi:hypothetical protein